MDTIAYEIGAVFLLAALLMYGTLGGFIPRHLKGGAAFAVLAGIAALGFVVYHFAPDLYALWRPSYAGSPSLTTSRPAPVAVKPVPRRAKSSPPVARAKKEPDANWKTTIVDGSVPAAAEPAVTPVPKAAEDVQTKPDDTPKYESSPYDSRTKRAIKSIGHFLHIERKKEQ